MHRKESYIQKIRGLNVIQLPASTGTAAIESASAAKTAPIAGATAESIAAATTATKATHE